LVRIPFGEAILTDELLEEALACIDQESRARARRFYHREDRWRCVIGRILPRVLLTDRGIHADAIKIVVTGTGKPYIVSPVLNPRPTFNISHDSNYVAIAYEERAGVDEIGLDIMKAELPRGETVASFASVLSDQLTQRERLYLASRLGDRTAATQILYKYWTVKEAYTKVLGLGVGFDFSRVEYSIASSGIGEDRVFVDGTVLRGWEFRGFTFVEGRTHFIGMVAMRRGEDDTTISWTDLDGPTTSGCEWLDHVDFMDLMRRAKPIGA